MFFFFKQKTAYEMRISDWSSDVCSSDLWWARPFAAGQVHAFLEQLAEHLVVAGRQAFDSARASRSMRLDRASEGLVRQMSRRNGGRLRSAAKRSRMFMTGASCLRPGHGGVDIRCVRVWCRLPRSEERRGGKGGV